MTDKYAFIEKILKASIMRKQMIGMEKQEKLGINVSKIRDMFLEDKGLYQYMIRVDLLDNKSFTKQAQSFSMKDSKEMVSFVQSKTQASEEILVKSKKKGVRTP